MEILLRFENELGSVQEEEVIGAPFFTARGQPSSCQVDVESASSIVSSMRYVMPQRTCFSGPMRMHGSSRVFPSHVHSKVPFPSPPASARNGTHSVPATS